MTYMYQTAKFDRYLKNLSWDVMLTDRCPEKEGKEYEKQKQ